MGAVETPRKPPQCRCRGTTRRDFFPEGSLVEVRTNEKDWKGVFFRGTVIPRSSGRKPSRKLCIEYHDLLAVEGSLERLVEYVDVEAVRPAPPFVEIQKGLEKDDLVDAFYQDGWWTGIVTRVFEEGRYIVSFQLPPDELEFGVDELRLHWDWVDGSWVRFVKQSKAVSMFKVGSSVEFTKDGLDFPYAWYPAMILQVKNDGVFLVGYDIKNMDTNVVEHKEGVSSRIRPCPPLLKDTNFNLLEKVDALFESGWWQNGVITEELEDSRYVVFFQQMNMHREFSFSDLRPHLEWKDGSWYTSSQRPINVQCGELSTVDSLDRSIKKKSRGSAKKSSSVDMSALKFSDNASVVQRIADISKDQECHEIGKMKEYEKVKNEETRLKRRRGRSRKVDIDDIETPATPNDLERKDDDIDMVPALGPAGSRTSIMIDLENGPTTGSSDSNIRRTKLLKSYSPRRSRKNAVTEAVDSDVKGPTKQVVDSFERGIVIFRPDIFVYDQPLSKSIEAAVQSPSNHDDILERKDDDIDMVPALGPADSRTSIMLDQENGPTTGSSDSDIGRTKLLKSYTPRRSRKNAGENATTEVVDSNVKSEGPTKQGIDSLEKGIVVFRPPIFVYDQPLSKSIKAAVQSPSNPDDVLERKGDDIDMVPALGPADSRTSIMLDQENGPTTGSSDSDIRRTELLKSYTPRRSRNNAATEVVDSDVNSEGPTKQVVDSLEKEVVGFRPPIFVYDQPLSKSIEAAVQSPSNHDVSSRDDSLECSGKLVESLPFVKESILWTSIESMDVFQRMPQRPHFQPLENLKGPSREGLAIGYMVTFSTLFNRISRLKLNDPVDVVDDISETIKELERHGFDVGILQNRFFKLCGLRKEHEKVSSEVDELSREMLEEKNQSGKIDEEIAEIERQIEELQAKLSESVSKKRKLVEEMECLEGKLKENEGKRSVMASSFEAVAGKSYW